MVSARSIATKTVITSDGRILGRLGSAMVDEDWSIPRFSVLLDREAARRFQIRKPLLGAPKGFLPTDEVAALSDNVILNRRLTELDDHVYPRGEGQEATKMLGKKVVGEAEYYFGDLEDLTLDQAHWRVLDLFVEVRKRAADDMGFPLTLFGTCQAKVPVKRVDAMNKNVFLGMGPDGFREYVIKEKHRE